MPSASRPRRQLYGNSGRNVSRLSPRIPTCSPVWSPRCIRLGVVREDVAIAATYLTVTSRLLLRRVITLLRRGTAAAGKNYVFEQVLLLLPRGA